MLLFLCFYKGRLIEKKYLAAKPPWAEFIEDIVILLVFQNLPIEEEIKEKGRFIPSVLHAALEVYIFLQAADVFSN